MPQPVVPQVLRTVSTSARVTATHSLIDTDSWELCASRTSPGAVVQGRDTGPLVEP